MDEAKEFLSSIVHSIVNVNTMFHVVFELHLYLYVVCRQKYEPPKRYCCVLRHVTE